MFQMLDGSIITRKSSEHRLQCFDVINNKIVGHKKRNHFYLKIFKFQIKNHYLCLSILIKNVVWFFGDLAFISHERFKIIYLNSNQDVMVRKTKATLSAPMDHINLHVRGGYILPAQQPATTTYARYESSFVVNSFLCRVAHTCLKILINVNQFPN